MKIEVQRTPLLEDSPIFLFPLPSLFSSSWFTPGKTAKTIDSIKKTMTETSSGQKPTGVNDEGNRNQDDWQQGTRQAFSFEDDRTF